MKTLTQKLKDETKKLDALETAAEETSTEENKKKFQAQLYKVADLAYEAGY